MPTIAQWERPHLERADQTVDMSIEQPAEEVGATICGTRHSRGITLGTKTTCSSFLGVVTSTSGPAILRPARS